VNEFKSKGVDQIAVIGSNDSWVMNAWGKVNGVKGDEIVSFTYTTDYSRLPVLRSDSLLTSLACSSSSSATPRPSSPRSTAGRLAWATASKFSNAIYIYDERKMD
jgi:hypothetical protein